MLSTAIEWILHLDTYLEALAADHHVLVYILLFAVIFIETGVVVMPFLPGDSLLFVAGAIAAKGILSVPVLVPLLILFMIPFLVLLLIFLLKKIFNNWIASSWTPLKHSKLS